MSAPLLDVSGLSTHFFTKAGVVKAVEDVSFSLGRGEVLGLVGESGSGKSMTGYSIMGLIDPPGRVVAGRVMFDGQDLRTLAATGASAQSTQTGLTPRAVLLGLTSPAGEGSGVSNGGAVIADLVGLPLAVSR